MESSVTKKLLDIYAGKRAQKSTVDETLSFGEAQRLSYHQAAAVLHLFSPVDILPLQLSFKHERPHELLYDDVVYISGDFSNRLFTLKPELRRNALKSLASRDAMLEALNANPKHEFTQIQVMWEQFLNAGNFPDPEAMGYQELVNLRQIVSWIDGVLDNLPNADNVQALVQQKSILSAFEHLVNENFTGRQNELKSLQEHLDGGIEDSVTSILRDKFLEAIHQKDAHKPVLYIHGPGGANLRLSAVSLNDLSNGAKNYRIPFAYLAFDQPTLRVDRPFTILVEAANQFALQFPERSAAIQEFNNNVRQYRDDIGGLIDRSVTFNSRIDRIISTQDNEEGLYQQFADLLKVIDRWSDHPNFKGTLQPVLLCLDTFEEVRYVDRERLIRFWNMLSKIIVYYPSFRIIISGRGTLDKDIFQDELLNTLNLTALFFEDRLLLLQKLGVKDADVAKAVASQGRRESAVVETGCKAGS